MLAVLTTALFVIVILVIFLVLKQRKITSLIALDAKTHHEHSETLRASREQIQAFEMESSRQIETLETRLAGYVSKYDSLIDKDKELERKIEAVQEAATRLVDLQNSYGKGLEVYKKLQHESKLYEDSLELNEFGLHKPMYSFQTSEEYKKNLDENYEKQKNWIKMDMAATCHIEWEVGGSKAEGKRMTDRYKKLMLFAFNGECDALIAKVKWNNANKIEERIRKSFATINKLGEVHRVEITDRFLQIKLQELALTFEHQQKIYEEREEQRAIREQMREEEKAQKELERAQRDAEDEEKRYQIAIEKVQKELGYASQEEMQKLNEQMNFLEQQLAEAHERKERAISMAQLTKVGHIYVISNLGSFGENVYKIGMTRRLDPSDRIKELGDASVPFGFDVHAIIYSENAPSLERELHIKFAERRLNKINLKKEFFRVTLDEIETFVHAHAGAEIMFTKVAEAREYRETMTMLEQLLASRNDIAVEAPFPENLV